MSASSESFIPRQQEYAFPAAPWTFNPSDIASVPMLPEVSEEPFYREQRSMSYSYGHEDLFSTSLANQFLGTIMQEDDEEEIFERTRSKSSAAIMDIWNTPESNQIEDAKWMAAHHRFGEQQRRFSLRPSISLLERFVCV